MCVCECDSLCLYNPNDVLLISLCSIYDGINMTLTSIATKEFGSGYLYEDQPMKMHIEEARSTSCSAPLGYV